jgi:hypothetical protein
LSGKTVVLRARHKHGAAEDQSLEQWFLVAISDDEKARDAVALQLSVRVRCRSPRPFGDATR